jgi:nucleotide-binding universal stress UspA family protein
VDGIIIGVNGSVDCVAALRWAAAFGRRHHLSLTALTAVPAGGAAHDDTSRLPRTDAALVELIDAVLGEGHGVRTIVTPGAADEVLVRASADADLLVVGAASPRHGMGRIHPRSVADVVAEHAACPVAIVRDEATSPSDAIVVGVDGSPSSLAALRWACQEAAASGHPVLAVHAWHVEAPFHVVVTDDDVVEQELAAARIVDQAVASVPDLPADVTVETRTHYGTPTGALSDAVPHPAMIVVGTRRLSHAQRVLVGSTGHFVMHERAAVVVIVPPPRTEPQRPPDAREGTEGPGDLEVVPRP